MYYCMFNIYSDTFNENSPPTNDPTYISNLGAAVYKAMARGDKDAIWLMQVCILRTLAGVCCELSCYFSTLQSHSF